MRRHSPDTALVELINGPLADAEEYPWSALVQCWPDTGCRLTELKDVLHAAVREGYLALHGDEVEARYRLLPRGRAVLKDNVDLVGSAIHQAGTTTRH